MNLWLVLLLGGLRLVLPFLRRTLGFHSGLLLRLARRRGGAFVVELDGLHTIHLGDVGHLLTEEKLGDIGSIDIACVPVGGALTATKAAELVAQLDPKIVVAMPVCPEEADCADALARFFHEMGGTPAPQPKLSVSISTLPDEVTTVVLESRSKV